MVNIALGASDGVSVSRETLISSIVEERDYSSSTCCHKVRVVAALILGLLIVAGGAVMLALLCACSPLPFFCAGVVLVALGAVILGIGIANVCGFCFRARGIEVQKQRLLQQEEELADLQKKLSVAQSDVEKLIEEKIAAQQTSSEIVQSLSGAIEDLTVKCQDAALESQAKRRLLEEKISALRERCKILEGSREDARTLLEETKQELVARLGVLEDKYYNSLATRRALRLDLEETQAYAANLEETRDRLLVQVEFLQEEAKKLPKRDRMIEELKTMISQYEHICEERGDWIRALKSANQALLEESRNLVEQVQLYKEWCEGNDTEDSSSSPVGIASEGSDDENEEQDNFDYGAQV
ncbi:IncA family protein [Chlamydia suis]|uniref:IncA family protein n=1 Tax=Chlamydia suis TaxID=83559 RepID=UPI0009E41CA6|nr:IncA family protein [Chlamydia suis]